MVERSTAAVLQEKLTEHGLVRALARQDISPKLVHELTVEQAARLVQRSIGGPGRSPKMAKKARKKTGYVHKAKKSKNKGRSAVRVVQPNYWGRVKRELHLLICINDKKYAALRKHLGKEDNTTQVAIISSISLTVAAYIGAAAAIVGPLVTLGLLALLQVGKNAWCAGEIT